MLRRPRWLVFAVLGVAASLTLEALAERSATLWAGDGVSFRALPDPISLDLNQGRRDSCGSVRAIFQGDAGSRPVARGSPLHELLLCESHGMGLFSASSLALSSLRGEASIAFPPMRDDAADRGLGLPFGSASVASVPRPRAASDSRRVVEPAALESGVSGKLAWWRTAWVVLPAALGLAVLIHHVIWQIASWRRADRSMAASLGEMPAMLEDRAAPSVLLTSLVRREAQRAARRIAMDRSLRRLQAPQEREDIRRAA